jgi:CheY-like chemotaxis protein
LVVDDDDAIRDCLHLLLEGEGYTVLEASRGDIALRQLIESPAPLVVLLDHFMPAMTGAEVIRLVAGDGHLLQRHTYLQLTAAVRTFSPDFLALLASMHIPVVTKPFDVDTVLDLVAEQAQRIEGQERPSQPQPAAGDHAE